MKKYKVASYIRISRDESYSKSDSIDNQIKLTDFYCKENKLEVIDKYIDNGYSGTSFDRPSFKKLLKDIDEGLINTVVVKDLSRLGRNYIMVGHYLQHYFPAKNVRFISINDNYDSLIHRNIMERLDVPLKNMMYDHVAYDISGKIKNSLRISKEKGNFIGSSVIYGYRKDPSDIHKLIIDNEAADVVRNIFQMYLLGLTKSEIANELNNREVLTPALYKKINNLGYTKPKKDNKWNYEIINRILRDENYTGTLVQGRRRNENYISHKKVKNPEKDWIKFENHHEAIIDTDNFIKVQERLKIQRRKTNKNDILSGYLKCADCNGSMMLVKGKKNEYYYCRNSISKKICTKHTFRKENLLEEVLNQINLKKLDDQKIKELSREVVINYLDSVIVYEDNKLEVIMKYESELINN